MIRRAWAMALAGLLGCSGTFREDDAKVGEAGAGSDSHAGEGGDATGGSQTAKGGTGGKVAGVDDGGEGGSPAGGTGGAQAGSGGTGESGDGGSDATGGTAGDPGEAGAPSAGVGGAQAGMPGVGGEATGGAAGTGGLGVSGSSAIGGTGGAVATDCDAFAVDAKGFVQMPAVAGGCWHGYAFAEGSGETTVTFCGNELATDFSSCAGNLSISGALEEAVDPDYSGFVVMGFALRQEQGASSMGSVRPGGTGLVVTGAAAGGRVQLQAGSNYWCAPFTSGTPIPYATFNTKCWDNSGTAYNTATPIDTIALQIPGGATSTPYSIALTSVAEF